MGRFQTRCFAPACNRNLIKRGVNIDLSGCPLGSDKDGVPDYKDQCPGTPRGAKVHAKGRHIPVANKSAEVTKAGTWIDKDTQFEVNKADLKEGSYLTLNEIVAALNTQPTLSIEILGRTDSAGKHDYNVDLSQFQGKLPTPRLGRKTFLRWLLNSYGTLRFLHRFFFMVRLWIL